MTSTLKKQIGNKVQNEKIKIRNLLKFKMIFNNRFVTHCKNYFTTKVQPSLRVRQTSQFMCTFKILYEFHEPHAEWSNTIVFVRKK